MNVSGRCATSGMTSETLRRAHRQTAFGFFVWKIRCLVNRSWCWGIVTNKVMGNQVCALNPSAWWGSSQIYYFILFCRRGHKDQPTLGGYWAEFAPVTKWPKDISGRIGVEKPVLGLVSWKLRNGEVSVSVQFDKTEVGGAGGRVEQGWDWKENSSQTIMRLVWGHRMLTKSLSLPPTWYEYTQN